MEWQNIVWHEFKTNLKLLQGSNPPENSQREEVEFGRALGCSSPSGEDQDVHPPEQGGGLTTTSQKRREKRRRRKTKKTAPLASQHQQESDRDAGAPFGASSSQTLTMERMNVGLLDPNDRQEVPLADTCKVISAFLQSLKLLCDSFILHHFIRLQNDFKISMYNEHTLVTFSGSSV